MNQEGNSWSRWGQKNGELFLFVGKTSCNFCVKNYKEQRRQQLIEIRTKKWWTIFFVFVRTLWLYEIIEFYLIFLVSDTFGFHASIDSPIIFWLTRFQSTRHSIRTRKSRLIKSSLKKFFSHLCHKINNTNFLFGEIGSFSVDSEHSRKKKIEKERRLKFVIDYKLIFILFKLNS